MGDVEIRELNALAGRLKTAFKDDGDNQSTMISRARFDGVLKRFIPSVNRTDVDAILERPEQSPDSEVQYQEFIDYICCHSETRPSSRPSSAASKNPRSSSQSRPFSASRPSSATSMNPWKQEPKSNRPGSGQPLMDKLTVERLQSSLANSEQRANKLQEQNLELENIVRLKETALHDSCVEVQEVRAWTTTEEQTWSKAAAELDSATAELLSCMANCESIERQNHELREGMLQQQNALLEESAELKKVRLEAASSAEACQTALSASQMQNHDLELSNVQHRDLELSTELAACQASLSACQTQNRDLELIMTRKDADLSEARTELGQMREYVTQGADSKEQQLLAALKASDEMVNSQKTQLQELDLLLSSRLLRTCSSMNELAQSVSQNEKDLLELHPEMERLQVSLANSSGPAEKFEEQQLCAALKASDEKLNSQRCQLQKLEQVVSQNEKELKELQPEIERLRVSMTNGEGRVEKSMDLQLHAALKAYSVTSTQKNSALEADALTKAKEIQQLQKLNSQRAQFQKLEHVASQNEKKLKELHPEMERLRVSLANSEGRAEKFMEQWLEAVQARDEKLNSQRFQITKLEQGILSRHVKEDKETCKGISSRDDKEAPQNEKEFHPEMERFRASLAHSEGQAEKFEEQIHAMREERCTHELLTESHTLLAHTHSAELDRLHDALAIGADRLQDALASKEDQARDLQSLQAENEKLMSMLREKEIEFSKLEARSSPTTLMEEIKSLLRDKEMNSNELEAQNLQLAEVQTSLRDEEIQCNQLEATALTAKKFNAEGRWQLSEVESSLRDKEIEFNKLEQSKEQWLEAVKARDEKLNSQSSQLQRLEQVVFMSQNELDARTLQLSEVESSVRDKEWALSGVETPEKPKGKEARTLQLSDVESSRKEQWPTKEEQFFQAQYLDKKLVRASVELNRIFASGGEETWVVWE